MSAHEGQPRAAMARASQALTRRQWVGTLAAGTLAALTGPGVGAQPSTPSSPATPATSATPARSAAKPAASTGTGLRLVVPFPAGGASAVLAKVVAGAYQRRYGQPLPLDYREGMGGLKGAAFAATQPANGKHWFMGGSHLVTARALSPSASFDLQRDLRPVALVAYLPQVLLVNPQRLRVRTAQEWLLEVGRKPPRYRMASAGVGSSSHLGAEILRQQLQLSWDYVHFRGSGPGLQGVLSGAVDMMVDALPSCLPHIRNGRLDPVMVTGTQRVAVLPEVPCAQELGWPGLEDDNWYALFVPRRTSDAVVRQLQGQLQQLLDDPVLQVELSDLGVRPGQLYGDALDAWVRSDAARWAQRIPALGLPPMVWKDQEV